MSEINDEIMIVVKALSQLKKKAISALHTLGTDSIPQEIWNESKSVIRDYLVTDLSWDTGMKEESNVSDVIQQLFFSPDILVLAEAIMAIPDCRTLNNTAQPQPRQTMNSH